MLECQTKERWAGKFEMPQHLTWWFSFTIQAAVRSFALGIVASGRTNNMKKEKNILSEQFVFLVQRYDTYIMGQDACEGMMWQRLASHVGGGDAAASSMGLSSSRV